MNAQDEIRHVHRRGFETMAIHSTPSDISSVRSAIVTEAVRRGFTEAEVFALTLGLSEALANAYLHGNRGMPDKLILVHYRVVEDHAEIRVIDEGDGFDPALVPDPTDPQHLELAHGRGLLLMQALLDEVSFCRKGTCVRLIKRHGERDNAKAASGTPSIQGDAK